jgi:hypothetical protein
MSTAFALPLIIDEPTLEELALLSAGNLPERFKAIDLLAVLDMLLDQRDRHYAIAKHEGRVRGEMEEFEHLLHGAIAAIRHRIHHAAFVTAYGCYTAVPEGIKLTNDDLFQLSEGNLPTTAAPLTTHALLACILHAFDEGRAAQPGPATIGQLQAFNTVQRMQAEAVKFIEEKQAQGLKAITTYGLKPLLAYLLKNEVLHRTVETPAPSEVQDDDEITIDTGEAVDLVADLVRAMRAAQSRHMQVAFTYSWDLGWSSRGWTQEEPMFVQQYTSPHFCTMAGAVQWFNKQCKESP